jgi:hypothetical protein
MDQVKIATVKALASEFNQFRPSQLQPSIQVALPSAPQATVRDYGESHCNLLSWYFALIADGRISMSYAQYFKMLMDAKCVAPSGYLLKEKNVIAKSVFGMTQNRNYLMDFKNVRNPSMLDRNSFYQIKLVNPMHYMISWIEEKETGPTLMIADTHNRGIGVMALGKSRINGTFFKWLLKIGE